MQGSAQGGFLLSGSWVLPPIPRHSPVSVGGAGHGFGSCESATS